MGRLCVIFLPLVLSTEAPDDTRTVNLEKIKLKVYMSWSVMWPRKTEEESMSTQNSLLGMCGS